MGTHVQGAGETSFLNLPLSMKLLGTVKALSQTPLALKYLISFRGEFHISANGWAEF